MTSSRALVCDGCGQMASAEHIARRLQRLEWTTRYRPVHISTLFLGAFSPRDEKEFLYALEENFTGRQGCYWMRCEFPPREEPRTPCTPSFSVPDCF